MIIHSVIFCLLLSNCFSLEVTVDFEKCCEYVVLRHTPLNRYRHSYGLKFPVTILHSFWATFSKYFCLSTSVRSRLMALSCTHLHSLHLKTPALGSISLRCSMPLTDDLNNSASDIICNNAHF